MICDRGCNYSLCTPDEGCDGRQKRVEWFTSKQISAYCCISDFFNLELRCTEPRIKKFFSLDVYITIAHIATCFGPQGNIFRESNQSNTAHNQISHFLMHLTWCNRVKCRHFFAEMLCKCDGSWYTVSWKQPTYLTKVSKRQIFLHLLKLLMLKARVFPP